MSELSPTGPAAEELRALVREVLDRTARRGASAAEAAAGRAAGLSVTVRLGEVETIEHNRDKSLSLTLYAGRRKGSASTSDFSAPALADTVETAWQIAAHGGEDACAGLADPELLAREIPDLDLLHPWDLDAEQAAALALEAERTALSADPRLSNSDGATAGTSQSLRVYGNSEDFLGTVAGSRHSLSTVVIAEADGAMQRNYWYTSSRVPGELEPAAEVGRRAAERTLRRLGGRQIPTCKVPVLYAAEIASSLVGHFIGAASGGSIYRDASFLVGHLGKRIFPGSVSIRERPRLLRGIGSAPFDREGVATSDRPLVEAGVLESYLLSTYSARKLGLRSTGNAGGARNVSITLGDPAAAPDLPALLAEMGTGLYITELIGMGVNTVTGDYSRGAAGFWVENGQITHPVEEITVAGNLREMFLGMAAIGGDVDRRGNVCSGSILIEQMTIAGS